MAIKYKQVLKQLFEDEKALFTEFKLIHNSFVNDPANNKTKFNEVGSKVMLKLKQAEDALCTQTEKGKYSNFSNQLSEKYWEEVRKYFSHIDSVEVKYGIEAVNIDDLF